MSEVKPILLQLIHGRCGSTLLMQLLCSNKNVICERSYPFEHRYLTYLSKLSDLFKQDRLNDWNDSNLLLSDGVLGPLPYDVSIFDKRTMSERLFRSNLNVFLNNLFLSNKQNVDLSKPLYYPEKIPHDVAKRIQVLKPSKSIYLIRDPRDIFVSVKSFNKKRGKLGFGWKKDQTDIEYAEWLSYKFKQFLIDFNNISNSDTVFKVRYEDIISEPYVVTEKLSKWLDVELNYDAVLRNSKAMLVHKTSDNNNSSINRWETFMECSTVRVFEDILGSELIKAGYNVK